MIKLKSSDNDIIEVKKEDAMHSITIRHLLEDIDNDDIIPLPTISTTIIEKVVEYAHYLTQNKKYDIDFYTDMTQATIFQLILAANYLEFKHLLDSACTVISNMIKGKSVEEIRTLFNIDNDFTPEEYEQVRKENEWIEN